jgi:hypothetical protein
MGFASPICRIISSLHDLSPCICVAGLDGWDSDSSIDDVPVSRFGGTLPGTLYYIIYIYIYIYTNTPVFGRLVLDMAPLKHTRI